MAKTKPREKQQGEKTLEKNNPQRVQVTQRRSYARHYEKNRESIIKKTVAYKKNKRDIEPSVRAFDAQKGRLRALVTTLVKRGAAAEGGRRLKPSTLETLGVASRAEFTAHLERLFYPCPRTGQAMTWANYGGRGGWEIDHVRPIAAFDFTHCQTASDLAAVLREAFHHTNLQPIWGSENRRKSSRYDGHLHRLRLPARLLGSQPARKPG